MVRILSQSAKRFGRFSFFHAPCGVVYVSIVKERFRLFYYEREVPRREALGTSPSK